MFGRKRREERERQRVADAAVERLREWESEREELESRIEMAKTVREEMLSPTERMDNIPVVLRKGEYPFGVLRGVALLESRRGPGQSVGGFGSIGGGARVGVSHRVYIPGEENLTPLDEGVATITSQRVAFQGSKQTREWSFAKLIGIEHADEPISWTALHVSNRQKTSGIAYAEEHAGPIRFRLELAIAVYTDGEDRLAADLESRLTEHLKAKPEAAKSENLVGRAASAPPPPPPPART